MGELLLPFGIGCFVLGIVAGMEIRRRIER